MAARIKSATEKSLMQNGLRSCSLQDTAHLSDKHSLESEPVSSHQLASAAQTATADADKFIDALKKRKATTHRPVRGHATITACPSDSKGLSVVLHVADEVLVIDGGAELDHRVLDIPLHHVKVVLVPDHCNTFCLTANTPERAEEGIFVLVKDSSARDRWLSALAAMKVQVEGPGHLAPGLPDLRQELAFRRRLSCTGTLPLVCWLS